MELASALIAAAILADAAVTPIVSKMTYNVSSGTLNHTPPLYSARVTNFWPKLYTEVVADDKFII